MAEPKVSIIVRCRNNWTYTEKCIASIEKSLDPDLYRLIVVDDGSTDETHKQLILYGEQQHCDFVHIPINKPKGAVTATNTGLGYVFSNPTKYILILDNDTEVLDKNESWLEDMIKYFEEDEAVGAVGACSDNVIGLQNVGKITSNEESKFLISFCMMVSFKCAKKVGLWDEIFNPGNSEDIDFSWRAKRAGFKLAVAKDVFIRHYCHQTFNQMGLNDLIANNERKLLTKWGERLYYAWR